MLGQVDRRGPVRGGSIVADQFIALIQGVGHLNVQRAGVTFFSVHTRVLEEDSHSVFVLNRSIPPNDLVEALDPAVEVVLPIVSGQFVLDSVQSETPLGNAVGVASHQRAEKGVLGKIALQGVESQDDVVEIAVPVGGPEGDDDAAVGDDPDFKAGRIRQSVDSDALAVRSGPEVGRR